MELQGPYGQEISAWSDAGLINSETAELLLLPYLLPNVLWLILAAIVFFVWFGSFSGYSSAWHGSWFGMNYPSTETFKNALLILALQFQRAACAV